MIEKQQNNPLNGLDLEDLLSELVEFYGWNILAAELRFECFAGNPDIQESLQFLSDTSRAREKLEAFYLYRFKGMPKPFDEQYKLPPRERGFAVGIVPRDTTILTAEKGKSKASPSNKQHFQPYTKSRCDRGYCLPKSKSEK
ncbi:VF530 family DNA-binding protein [Psychromonas sp.]|uniref:VF530 family DNA-binding protein n=1 Tax=Psychromonas sp. TaxID=1884585 RepID=UPI00356866E0